MEITNSDYMKAVYSVMKEVEGLISKNEETMIVASFGRLKKKLFVL